MKKKEIKLVIILSIVYFFCQISRSDLSVVFVDLIPDTGYTKEQVGLAITAGYISYAVGMLVNSLLVERANPKRMVALALGGCFSTHLIIRLCPLLPVMIAAWCVNGYLQSMIWPCVVRLFTADLRQEVRVRAMSIVSLAQHAGSVSCFLLVPLGLTLGDGSVVCSNSPDNVILPHGPASIQRRANIYAVTYKTPLSGCQTTYCCSISGFLLISETSGYAGGGAP